MSEKKTSKKEVSEKKAVEKKTSKKEVSEKKAVEKKTTYTVQEQFLGSEGGLRTVEFKKGQKISVNEYPNLIASLLKDPIKRCKIK